MTLEFRPNGLYWLALIAVFRSMFGQSHVRNRNMTLTLAEAQKVIDGAITKARELKVSVCVTVCSAEGHLIALNRMDGAFEASSRASIGKALAAALTGRPSA